MKTFALSPAAKVVAVGAVLAATALVPAQAVGLVGLTTTNRLALFDSASPGMATLVSITGLDAGDHFVGIDLRPTNNTIYGVTASNRIYTVDELTGAASFVAALSAPVVDTSLGYGIDFNPVADFGGGSSLRLVSSAGANFAINAGTGVVGNMASTIAPGFTAVAYSNSNPMGTMAPPSTALYYINSLNNTLSVAASAFNAPTITTVGALGVDVLRANGFELTSGNMGFAALNVDGALLTTGLYGINLMTGQATLMGQYNGTLSGLTVSAVPEPGTYALMGLGLAGLLLARRRLTQQEAV